MAKGGPPGAEIEWFEHLPCAMTVCDRNYKILYMNELAARAAAEDGGRALIGKNLLDCHPPEAQKRLKEVMASGLPNVYTVEKGRVKKMVFQGQWKERERARGLVELVFELPERVPHHNRE